ncbi:MAG: DNA alkylation repair protein [Eubacterium sp.]
MMNLREELFNNQDLKYKQFHSKLVPNISNDKIIGVRVPILRKIAKQAFKENAENLCVYYEEQVVRGLTIGMKKCSAEEHIEDIKAFVPLIDNWATCDICSSSFKFVKKNQDDYFDFLVSYIDKSEFETRFGIVMLMDFYLDDKYIDIVLDILKSVKSEYYYVNMAVAWALSVAFVKYEDKVTEILKAKILSKDVQNKTIQKIKDSFRVSKEIKKNLNQYKM